MNSGKIPPHLSTKSVAPPGRKKPSANVEGPNKNEAPATPSESVNITGRAQPIVEQAPAEVAKKPAARLVDRETATSALNANAPLLAEETTDSKAEVLHHAGIDGFLTKFMPSNSQPKIAKHEMLVTDETRFPSLEHGTRHKVSRTDKPEGYPDRGQVPDNWGGDYRPTPYTSPVVEKQPIWAEPTDFQEAVKARAEKSGMDGSNLSDKDIAKLFPSYEGSRVVDGQLRNPRGPTGITGQGLLGKQGENTAADPIVFRRHQDPETGVTKLQMIAIQRADNGKWAIPGGMTDYGETVSATLGRELREEALGDSLTKEQSDKFDQSFKNLFEERGALVYQGAVDDFRNTDTSWMATKVQMMEIDKSDADNLGGDMKLEGGDDAKEALWMDVTAENLSTLNANHGDFVGKAVQTWQKQTGLAVRKDGVVGTTE